MKKLIFSLVLGLFACVSIVSAQLRPIEKDSTKTNQTVNRAKIASVEARYEGGIFGYSEREKGTIKFDDENERLIFFSKDDTNRELFSIPYKRRSSSRRAIKKSNPARAEPSVLADPGRGHSRKLYEKEKELSRHSIQRSGR